MIEICETLEINELNFNFNIYFRFLQIHLLYFEINIC